MTTAWHQNNAAGLDDNGKTIKAGAIIDYIHTVGAVYNFGSTVLDVGYGEGKGYRRNWQAQVERHDTLTKDVSCRVSSSTRVRATLKICRKLKILQRNIMWGWF